MVCRTQIVDQIAYDYCPDELPPMADRLRAIMHGRFVDELSGNPIRAQLSATTPLANVRARASADAVAGLIANPAQRFPGLAGSVVELEMRVDCRRFVPRTLTGTLGPFNTGVGHPADFPDYFAAVDLGDIGLHRQATTIAGRCVLSDGANRTPLPGASVEIAGLWHRFPAADVDPPNVVETPDIISLVQGLYRERSAAADQLWQRTLLPQPGEEKSLLLPAAAGQTRLSLSDRVNLAAGHVLAIEPEHSERAEYLQVVAVDGASSDSQPARVTLAYPLRSDHRHGAGAVRVIPQPAGAANGLARDAIPGDQTLFLDGLAGIGNGTLEISGAGAPEFHRVRLYSAISDADGFFRLPPIARVAMLQLHASHAVPVAGVDTVISPNYEQFANRIDLIFG